MEISRLVEALQADFVWLVFANVFLQQIGFPVPAVPTLLLAGSLAATSGHLAEVLAAAVAASVLADWVWYLAGRAFGYRVLSGLCKFSINPASCISQTEARFERWGVGSLIVAKFIPGFAIVAPPIAGSLRMSLAGFLLAAGFGAALWSGLALGAGWLLREETQAAIGLLDRHTGAVVLALAAGVAAWLGWKLWQRFRFRRLAAVPHITPDELADAMTSTDPPLLLDLRGPRMVAELGTVDGAVVAEHPKLLEAVGDWPKDRLVATLCACPEDAGAIHAAQRLIAAGYQVVRPVKGGYEAWRAFRQKTGN